MHRNTVAKFMRLSSKVSGTQLNKQPKAKTDLFDDPKLAKKGSVNRDERVSLKPMTIKKKVSGQSQSTKFKPANKKVQPPKNKGIVKKYK